MRIADHHRQAQHEVEVRLAGNSTAVQPKLGDPLFDYVYASLIFERTKPVAQSVLKAYPHAKIGGTGWDVTTTLASVGIDPLGDIDYSDYPRWRSSLGFTQRGCRLKCSFCVVPRKEGAIQEVKAIADIWRGEGWPKHILLLDNDFFGQPHWRDRIQELQQGQFKVSFNQGINARMLTDETAEAIASVDYRDDSMKVKRLYTAWDNKKDQARLFQGLEALVRHGVKPDHIMVYMLCGYWKGETQADREYRRQKLRDFGCIPYPMPYVRTKEIVGFQRWIIGAYDKSFSWEEWVQAKYRPTNLNPHLNQKQLFSYAKTS